MGIFDTIIGGAQSIWGTLTGSQAAADVGGYGSQQQPATVTVQPKPPIVTSVKPAAGGGYTTTVSQSPNVPAPVTVQNTISAQPKPPIIATVTPSKTGLITTLTQSPNIPSPVSVPAPSIQESVLRGVNIAAAGSQAAIMDLTGLRSIQLQAKQQEIQNQQAAYETQLAGINLQAADIQNRATLLEQRNTALQSAAGELNAFIGTIPAVVSTPEEYSLAMQKVQIAQKASGQLQQEGGKLQGEYAGLSGEASNLQRESLYAQFEGVRLQQQGVNLNAEAAMVAETGIGGATNWFEENINKPASDYLLTNIGKPFGLSKEDVALSLAINKQIAETTFNYVPTPQAASYAYGAGMVEETLLKPGEAGIWAGIGLATGGIGRALGPVGKRLVAAGAIEGAGTGAKILGKAAQYGPKLLGYGMGAFYAVDVGGEVLSQPTAGAKISKLGGISGTQLFPMIAGGIIGYNAPEIWRGIQTRDLPIGFQTKYIEGEPPRKIRGIDVRNLEPKEFTEVQVKFEEVDWIRNPQIETRYDIVKNLPGVERPISKPSEITLKPDTSLRIERPVKPTSTGMAYPEEMQISAIDIGEGKVTFMQPKEYVSPIERRMLVEQLRITPAEQEYAKLSGISATDILQLRAERGKGIISFPEESLPDLRTEWGVIEWPSQSLPDLRTNIFESAFPRTFRLQEAKQLADIKFYEESGRLMKPDQKMRIDTFLNLRTNQGTVEITERDITNTLAAATGVSLLGRQTQQQKEDQDLFLMSGLVQPQKEDEYLISTPNVNRMTKAFTATTPIQGVLLTEIQKQEDLTTQLPDLAVTQIQLQTPVMKELQIQTSNLDLVNIQEITEIQIQELRQQEIQIPRFDYGYDFRLPDLNIPPFPPLVIPGFPGGIGGGGGGGGFGGQGGMLFEELFPLGEDVDVFGMGDLDMWAYVRANTPRTVRKKRKRRK